MKVLHLLSSNVFSGAENVACQIIQLFRDSDDIKMVYCSPVGSISYALLERNIVYVPIDTMCLHDVKRVIEMEKPDIIHAHDMKASFYAALAGSNKKIVSHIHNNNFENRGLTIKSIAYLLPAVLSRHIFWVSKSSYSGYFFHWLFKDKSSVLYNVIDRERLFKRVSEDSNTYDYDIVFLGRITKPKNPIRLLDVLEKALIMDSSLRIAIIGTGDMEDEFRKQWKKRHLEKNVELLGFQSNPYKMLYSSKVMVMTSLWEGTPMCVLEALSLGVPVVSTPTDGLIDLIESGQNGYLSDSNSQLSEYLVSISRNPALREKLSIKAKYMAERYNNLENYKNEIILYYNS